MIHQGNPNVLPFSHLASSAMAANFSVVSISHPSSLSPGEI